MALHRYLLGDILRLQRGEISPDEFTRRVESELAEDAKRREAHQATQAHMLESFMRSAENAEEKGHLGPVDP